MKKNFSKWGREIWYDICIIARRWCTLVGTYEILFYKYIKNLRVSRKSLPRCGDTLRKYPSAEREKIKKRRTLLVATLYLKSLRILCRFEFRRTVKGIKNRLLDSISFSIRSFAPLPTAILPFIFKIIFCLGTNDLESRVSRWSWPGSRAEDGRRTGISLARHRVDPLVKTARCPARFTISIDYKTYLGFLFHWYV